MKKKYDYDEGDYRKPTAGERASKYAKNFILTPVWGASKITGVALRFSARVIHIVTRLISSILVFCGILCPIMGICDFGTAVALIAGAIGVSLVPRLIYALGDGFSGIGNRVSDYWHEPPKIKDDDNEDFDPYEFEQECRQIDEERINTEYEIVRKQYLAMKQQHEEEGDYNE